MQISTYHSFCRNLLLDNTTSTGLGMRGGILDRPVFLVWGVQNIDKFGFDSHIEIGNIPSNDKAVTTATIVDAGNYSAEISGKQRIL